MNTVSKLGLCAVLLSGCAEHRVALPPEVIRVPVFMPLPAECGAMQPIVLPPNSTPTDVMAQLKAAVDAYNDQVRRCFKATVP